MRLKIEQGLSGIVLLTVLWLLASCGDVTTTASIDVVQAVTPSLTNLRVTTTIIATATTIAPPAPISSTPPSFVVSSPSVPAPATSTLLSQQPTLVFTSPIGFTSVPTTPSLHPSAAPTTIKPTTVGGISGTVPCQASTLKGRAPWQGATGSQVGSIYVTNTMTKDCTLRGRPTLRLIDNSNHELLTTIYFTDTPIQLVTLKAGESARAEFIWRNWCSPTTGTALPSGPLHFDVALPDNAGHIIVPATRADGTAASDTPRCDRTEYPSELSVGAFVAA